MINYASDCPMHPDSELTAEMLCYACYSDAQTDDAGEELGDDDE